MKKCWYSLCATFTAPLRVWGVSFLLFSFYLALLVMTVLP